MYWDMRCGKCGWRTWGWSGLTEEAGEHLLGCVGPLTVTVERASPYKQAALEKDIRRRF